LKIFELYYIEYYLFFFVYIWYIFRRMMLDEKVYIICFLVLFFIFIICENIRLYQLKVVRTLNKSNIYLDLFIWFFENLWVGLYFLFFIFYFLLYIFRIMLDEAIYIICFLVIYSIFNISYSTMLYELKVINSANNSNIYLDKLIWFLENYLFLILYWIFSIFLFIYILFFLE